VSRCSRACSHLRCTACASCIEADPVGGGGVIAAFSVSPAPIRRPTFISNAALSKTS
jgi:hypothetical protein